MVAPGVHPVVCTSIVDLGLQAPFNPAHKTVYKVAISFQFPTEIKENGEPHVLSLILTNSMHAKANLRKTIEGWFGKAFPSDDAAENFDLRGILGKAGYANVTHADRGEKTYANISSLIPLPKGMPAPEFTGELFYYSEEPGEMTPTERSNAYAALPEWLRNKVDNQVRAEEPAGNDDRYDDEVPF